MHEGATTGCTVSPVEKAPGKQTPKIHRGWVTVLAAGGLLITALAFGGRFVTGLGEDDLAVWQSILTNFGVGLLSAAVLLLFEPKFRRAVTDTVNTATAGVKEEVREAVQSDIDARLAPLKDRIDSLYNEKLAAQHAATKDLSTDFTYERVMKTLNEAAEVGALYRNSIRVQADPEPWVLHIGLQRRIPDDIRLKYAEVAHPIPPEEEEVLYLNATGGFGLWAEIPWEPHEDFSVAALNLATALSREQHRGINERIDWQPVLVRFEKAIRVAIDSANRTPSALHLHGALAEVAGPDASPWYLTSQGVHYPAQGWHITKWDVLKKTVGYPAEPLVMPEWANKAEWNYVIQAAESLYFDE